MDGYDDLEDLAELNHCIVGAIFHVLAYSLLLLCGYLVYRHLFVY